MRSSILLLGICAVLSLALPTPDGPKEDEKPKKGKCVKPPEAQKFIDRYIGFFGRTGSDLGDAKATGDALIADDVKQYSFSLSSLRGHSVTNGNDEDAGLIQNGKDSFINNVLTNRNLPVKGIKTLSALAACDEGESRIIWHWQFDEVTKDAKYPVRGFTMFNVERDDGPGEFKALEVNIEFDSIAWTLDDGGKVEGGEKEGDSYGHGV